MTHILKGEENHVREIVQLNEVVIKRQLKELVKESVEETLNEMLEAEAEKLSTAHHDENIAAAIMTGI